MASLPLSKRELSLFRHHNVIHVADAVPVAQLPIVFSHPCVPVPNDLPVLEGHLTKQTLGALQSTIAGIAVGKSAVGQTQDGNVGNSSDTQVPQLRMPNLFGRIVS